MPDAVRRMGDGYEPHVEEIDGKLIYIQPIDSGVVSFSSSFEITESDLAVLLADPYRRAVLEVIGHTIVQTSSLPGNTPTTQRDFDALVQRILYSTPADLERFIAEVRHSHHIVVSLYVKQAMTRRAARGDA